MGASGNALDLSDAGFAFSPATYEPLLLNQLTGWSRWLLTNKQKPLYLYTQLGLPVRISLYNRNER